MKLAAFDTETNGVDPSKDNILSWAVVTLLPGEEKPSVVAEGFIQPERPVPEDAVSVHGLTRERLKELGAVAPQEGLKDLLEALEEQTRDCPLVVFNARFDLSLLAHEAERNGLAPLWDKVKAGLVVLDPLVLDRKLNKYRQGNRRLGTLCERYEVHLDNWHDAAADSTASALLMRRLWEDHEELPGNPVALYGLQQAWHKEWWAGFRKWLVERGKNPAPEEGVWPWFEPQKGGKVEESSEDYSVILRPHPNNKELFDVEVKDDIDPRVLTALGAKKGNRSDRLVLPARKGSVDLLKSVGLSVSTELPEDWERQWRLDDYLSSAKKIGKDHPHKSWEKLDGHQRVGAAFLSSRERGLLSFAPGLGKSATSIVAAEMVGSLPVLVIAPLTLASTWRYEVGVWAENTEFSNLRDGEEVCEGWNFVNPESRLLNTIDIKQFGLIILDESVLYKSRSSQRTKLMRKLSRNVPRVWMLSGSPITHYADDLWAQLNILRPNWFSSYWQFARLWTHIEWSPWGDKVVGNKSPEMLSKDLRDIMLSRTAKEVPVLPDALLEVVKVDLSKRQVKELKSIKEDFKVNGKDIAGQGAQLVRMAQIVSYPRILGVPEDGAKLKALKDMTKWVARPVIVWCWFRDTVEKVQEVLEGSGLKNVSAIHGGVSSADREKAIDQFQSGESEAIVIQIATGRFGLSLTKAKAAIFFDRSFSLDDWVQATARTRRRSSTEVVPTYVLDAGWTDQMVNVTLRRKLRSVTDLELSDLLRFMN